jgi:ABC-type glycerol-3-phosphate transport system substrate-binding protein
MGAWLTGRWLWQELPKYAPALPLGAARMPVNASNPRSKPTTLAESVWTWAIAAASAHQEEAWALAKWLGLKEGHRSLVVRTGRPPAVRRVARETVMFDQNPGWALVLEALENATALPATRGWEKVKGTIERIPSDVLGNRVGLAEALASAEREARALLDVAHR